MQNNLYKRIARAEAMADAQKSEQIETLQRAYENACSTLNEEDAAFFARRIRNKLLDATDKQMSFDRLGLDSSSVTKFITSITKIFNGAWAQYRQQLRDLPQQEGFPFNITFPQPPEE